MPLIYLMKMLCTRFTLRLLQSDANGLPLLDESWKTNHITNPPLMEDYISLRIYQKIDLEA